MKNQYFGDISDYRKYGILRALAAEGGLRIGVNWMLTADDGRTDGVFTDYLENPERWRAFDPKLFDELQGALVDGHPGGRAVATAAARELIPLATYFDEFVPTAAASRAEWFGHAALELRASDLVFFDPDNGLEVKSRPYGRAGSEKHVFWSEVRDTYARDQSVLVFQYYPRRSRDAYHAELAVAARGLAGAADVRVLRTSRVAFLLLVQPDHRGSTDGALLTLVDKWVDQIQVVDV